VPPLKRHFWSVWKSRRETCSSIVPELTAKNPESGKHQNMRFPGFAGNPRAEDFIGYPVRICFASQAAIAETYHGAVTSGARRGASLCGGDFCF
jgi:hypothetical protein